MEYFRNKYSEVELIKKDNWADIYVAINNETKEKVQLKILKSQSDNTKYINSITYEIDQLQNLKHKNLIAINGIYNFIENKIIYYYIETEYFQGKTLSDKMILTGHTCKESLEIIKQVAEGLNEFHYRGLNYETLRGENIFINSEAVVKIDVLSYIQQKHDEEEEYNSYDEFHDGIDKDIYAVGVILYQLITRDQNFKLKKLKKNIEDEEVYSILYSLTSKKIKYRYENLNEFLLDVNEHLQNLSYNANKDLEYINESKNEDDFEEYEDKSNKFIFIKRLCACLAVVLVVVGGIKVAGLVKKDDNKTETQTEMIAEEESTKEEALEEESKEEQPENLQVEPTDTDTPTNDYNLNSDTEDDSDNNTTQAPNYGNNNSTTNNSGSSGSTSGGNHSGSGNNGSSSGGSNSGSGSSGSTSGESNGGSGNNGSTSGESNGGSGNNGSTSGGSNSGSGNDGSTSGESNDGAGTGDSNNDTSNEGTSDDNTSNGSDGTNTDSGDEGETSEQIQSME